MLHVNLLGTGGTLPLRDRMLSSAIMQYQGNHFLFDCGEGTQISMRRQRISLSRISAICITHVHADHVSGLPGLLLSIGADMRTEPVTVIGPKGIAEVVNSLRIIAPNLPYEIRFIELENDIERFPINGCRLTAFRVDHDVTCYGYAVEIDRIGKFSPQKAKENNVPMKVWKMLQKNERVEADGTVYTRDMAFEDSRRGIKIVFCTDTRPLDIIAEVGRDANLMILEGMFADEKKLPRALETHHMLFREAAELAAKANANELWLTHYSPSQETPELYISAATDVFKNTVCGQDGMEKEINFID